MPAEMPPRQGSLKNESGLTEDCKPGVAVKEESGGHTGKSVAEDHKPPSGLKPKKKSGLAGKRSALGTLRPPALTIPNRDSKTGSAEAEVLAQAMQCPSYLLTGFLTACTCDDLIVDDAGAGQVADDSTFACRLARREGDQEAGHPEAPAATMAAKALAGRAP